VRFRLDWHTPLFLGGENGSHIAETHLALIGGGDVADYLVTGAKNGGAITHADLALISGRGVADYFIPKPLLLIDVSFDLERCFSRAVLATLPPHHPGTNRLQQALATRGMGLFNAWFAGYNSVVRSVAIGQKPTFRSSGRCPLYAKSGHQLR
jgi:hypothetical protein